MIRFVEFRSPGSFLAETDTATIVGLTRHQIIKKAMRKAAAIKQRYGATPYAFRIAKTWYYLPHCEVTQTNTLPQTDENRILISNCLTNGWTAIVTTTTGWIFTQPFYKGCVLLDTDGKIKARGQ